MTKKNNLPVESVSSSVSKEEAKLRRGIARIEDRIADLQAVDLDALQRGKSPELAALESTIQDTLYRCFGDDIDRERRFTQATNLIYRGRAWINGMPAPDFRGVTGKNIASAVALLKEARRVLEEDIADLAHDTPSSQPVANLIDGSNRKVFLVHGHDEGAREAVARFFERLHFKVIILHEQANQGGTIIEKIEQYGDVGFAVVLLTPDDEGCKKGDTPMPRARQNVLLELGYFMGRLGRKRVSALKRANVDLPTDFAGMVWIPFDDAAGWQLALARELKAAGYDIDLNIALG
ncbi:TIR domain-containing protein [Pseudomonas marginalis]